MWTTNAGMVACGTRYRSCMMTFKRRGSTITALCRTSKAPERRNYLLISTSIPMYLFLLPIIACVLYWLLDVDICSVSCVCIVVSRIANHGRLRLMYFDVQVL